MTKILVTGATGYIGGRLVPRLVDLGHDVRVLARDPRKLNWRNWSNVETFRGDAFDPESLRVALTGVEVAYYLIHSMTTSGSSFAERDRVAAKNFAEACAAAGVKRIIYLGGLGITGSALSKHLQSRHETGDILRSSPVPVTELRAAIIVGAGSASFIIIHDLVRKLPVMICPKWVQSRCEPISIRQVLAYLIGCLTEPRTIGQVLDIGGGEVLTYREMMKQCAEVMGRKLYILDIPLLTPNLSSYWLNLVTGVPMSLARPLVEGLKNDVVCSEHRIRDWIQVPDISYKQSVALALEKIKNNEVESAWTAANTSRSSGSITVPPRFRDVREALCSEPPEKVFAVIEAIGGANGWYHANALWRLRAAIDWLIGGVGMRRGRRDPRTLEVGDPVDFWRVEDRIPNELLLLRAEMKLPGTAKLAFRVTPEGAGSHIQLDAQFWPTPRWGYLYWWSVYPVHGYVFRGLLREIQRRSSSSS